MDLMAIVGFLILAAVMFFVLKGYTVPSIAFVVFPLIGALVTGFGIKEIGDFVTKGLNTTWKTAVLFIFSIIFFGVMSDVGLFDKPVNWITKKASHSIVGTYLAAAIIAVIGHLDGASVTTYIITLTAMLPIFKKLKLNVLNLLLVMGLATGVMNLVPWGGPTIRAATALGIDANILWHHLIPIQIVGLVITLGVAAFLGVMEQKKLAVAGGAISMAGIQAEVEQEEKENPFRKPKLDVINWILVIGVIGTLVVNILPSFFVFMVGSIIALWVNFPSVKIQNERVQSYAPGIIGLTTTLLAAGVFLGVLSNSGMIEAMAKTLINIVPDGMKQYLHYIVGALGAPIGMTMGPDPYYYGVMPLIVEVVKPLAITGEQVANAMLMGENVALSVSPCVPTTFLLVGMAGVELKDHIRHSFVPMWVVSIVMMIAGAILGII